MSWKDIPKPPPTAPGTWEAFSYGADYHCWTLRCGPALIVSITRSGGHYYTTLNQSALPVATDLADAQDNAERAIVARVREILPAYKIIYERLEARSRPAASVTQLHPRKE